MLEYFKALAVNATPVDEQVGIVRVDNVPSERQHVGETVEQGLPAWLDTFAWALTAMQQARQEPPDAEFANGDRPIPFEELFVPVVVEARTRRDRSFSEPAPFSASALCSLDRALLGQLSDLCAVAFFEAFVIFRHLRQPLLLVVKTPQPATSGSLYQQFVTDFCTSQIQEFFLENSLLARWLATAIEQWIETTTELIQRFQSDRCRIAKHFNNGHDLGVVQAIEWGLSDPHQGGRTVCVLTFDRGLKLVYKPKDMGIDLAWSEFLQWLERHNAPCQLRAPQLLPGPGYGWAEFIAADQCTCASEVEAFFQRAGGLLCLLYLLQGTDYHSENVIASAAQPVAIDLETLISPWRSPTLLAGGLGEISAVAAAYFRNSVLATTYLPDWLVGQGDQYRAIGGLSPVNPCQVETHTFVNINRDGMQRVKRLTPLPAPRNLPCLDGKYPLPETYCEEIVTGFTRVYLFLIAQQQQLLDPTGGIACFKGKTVRVVLRPTEHYALLQRRRTARPYLRNGSDWSHCLQFLSATLTDGSESERLSAAQVIAERQALTRLDIPYFTALTDGLDLFADGQQTIANYFTVSSFDQVIARIKDLNQARMQRQIELIQDLITSTGSHRYSAPVTWVRVTDLDPPLSADRVLEQASKFVTLLEQEAIWAEASATWLGPVPLPGEQLHRLGVIGSDLYSGSSGIALFLAAFSAVSGEMNSRKLALAALSPLRQTLTDARTGSQLLRQMGLGGATGLGSAIYALVSVARLLNEPAMLADALQAATLISEERIQADSALDVIAGVAGTILALLALYRVVPEDAILQRSLHCGQHLLHHQVVLANGQRTWPTSSQIPLTGFSPGRTGRTEL